MGEIPFPLPTKETRFIATGAVTGFSLVPAMAAVPTQPRYVAVVSHDCEFTEGRRNHFLVARIENFPRNLTTEQLEEIRLGNDLEESARANRSFPTDTFYLDALEGIFEHPQRINFCTITPLAMSTADDMRTFKKAELDQPSRVQLRTKIGYFFAREADDIPEEDKAEAPVVIAVRRGRDD